MTHSKIISRSYLIGGDVYRVDVVKIVDGRRIIGGKPTVDAATKPGAYLPKSSSSSSSRSPSLRSRIRRRSIGVNLGKSNGKTISSLFSSSSSSSVHRSCLSILSCLYFSVHRIPPPPSPHHINFFQFFYSLAQ